MTQRGTCCASQGSQNVFVSPTSTLPYTFPAACLQDHKKPSAIRPARPDLLHHFSSPDPRLALA